MTSPFLGLLVKSLMASFWLEVTAPLCDNGSFLQRSLDFYQSFFPRSLVFFYPTKEPRRLEPRDRRFQFIDPFTSAGKVIKSAASTPSLFDGQRRAHSGPAEGQMRGFTKWDPHRALSREVPLWASLSEDSPRPSSLRSPNRGQPLKAKRRTFSHDSQFLPPHDKKFSPLLSPFFPPSPGSSPR